MAPKFSDKNWQNSKRKKSANFDENKNGAKIWQFSLLKKRSLNFNLFFFFEEIEKIAKN